MMKTLNLAASLAALVFLSSAAFAQTAAPATPTTQPKAPPPAATAPAPATPAAPKAATPAPAPAPAAVAPAATAPKAVPAATPAATSAQAVNLNTASEADLDKLPQIGSARAKAIVEARTKGGKFKNWDDFVARNVVPKNAEEAIKTLVKF